VALVHVNLPERSTTIRIQWRSGAVTEARIPRPRSSLARPRSEQAVNLIGEATVEGLTDAETAERLNALKIPAPGAGERTQARVRWIRRGRLGAEVVPHAGYPHARWVHLSEARALMQRKPLSERQQIEATDGQAEGEDA
jgi:hypothetical protein